MLFWLFWRGRSLNMSKAKLSSFTFIEICSFQRVTLIFVHLQGGEQFWANLSNFRIFILNSLQNGINWPNTTVALACVPALPTFKGKGPCSSFCLKTRFVGYNNESANNFAVISHMILTLRRYESVICWYLLHGCDVIRIFRLQFENENDVTPSVINKNRSRFPIF